MGEVSSSAMIFRRRGAIQLSMNKKTSPAARHGHFPSLHYSKKQEFPARYQLAMVC
jgi:hypothetical protein